MAWNVWFVPAQPNHVTKFKPLMEVLEARGCEIHTLCVDVAIPRRKSIRALLEKAGRPFEMFPPCHFRPFERWPPELLQRPWLRRGVRRWLDSHEADILIFGTDTPIVTREFIKEAQKRHIPRVHIHDGICGGANPLLRPGLLMRARIVLSTWLKAVFDIHPPRYERSADLFFVMDESSPSTLTAKGVPPDRIRVVGSPQYDALARQAESTVYSDEDRQRMREKIQAPPDRPILLYAHQHICRTADVKNLVRHMVAALRRVKGTLLVKFHPSSGEGLQDWVRWAAGEGMSGDEVVFILGDLLSIEAVQLCHACVTAYSTVALEAMLSRKPLILIQYLDVPVLLTYGEKYGAALEAFGPEELEAHVVTAMTDEAVRTRLVESARTCLDEELHGLDGRSTDRMADEIVALIRRYHEA